MQRSTLRVVVPAGGLVTALAIWIGAASIASGADSTQAQTTAGISAAEALAANAADHDEEDDYVWNTADVVSIILEGASASSTAAEGVAISGAVVTITAAGTYRLTGTLTDGQVLVSSEEDGIVRLILDGASIANSTTAALQIDEADKAMIVLVEGSRNTLSDASTYVYPDAETDEPNAALFSKADLTITGTGSLTVKGNAYDGIASKDGLIIDVGEIAVTAVDDGIRGKDYLVVNGGDLTVTAGGDGLTSTNDSDETKGYVVMAGGAATITAAGDGVSATTDIITTGGSLSVTAGGGSGAALAEDASAKGLKGTVSVVIGSGMIDVNAADDAIHSDDVVSIGGGTISLASGDDGIHAEKALDQSDGSLTVTRSVEGLESMVITLSGGTVDLTASDDGMNGTDGVTDSMMIAEGVIVTISGGTVLVDAGGDGLDSNGTLGITGGTIVVNGPTEDMNGALDANGTFTVSGGTLLAAGSSGMAVAPATTSEQGWVSATFAARQAAGTIVHLTSADGTAIAAFKSSKDFQSVVFSSDQITMGSAYNVYTGGSVSGASTGGMYASGDTSGATLVATVTAGQHTGGMPGGPGGGQLPSGMPPSGGPSGTPPSGMPPSEVPSASPSGSVAPSVSVSPSASASASASPSVSVSASVSPSPSRSGSTGTSCTATYTPVTQWPGGFLGLVKVTAGPVAVRSWTVTWTFTDGQTVTGVWNAAVQTAGSKITVKGTAYNGRISPSGSTLFGLVGTWRGSNHAPVMTCTAS
ncbi:MAG: carbohydrate-binding domain-containing protein [Micromonosporaceae bacterium]|nr:carbohydrate-binding domain-containing protein [Micromonosporaceae bacterium]